MFIQFQGCLGWSYFENVYLRGGGSMPAIAYVDCVFEQHPELLAPQETIYIYLT